MRRRRGWANLLRIGGIAGLATTMIGCAAPSPDGFAVIERSGPEVKAVAPDESLFWSREFANAEGGDLEFWVEAVRHEFVADRGYVLIAERRVARGGSPAHEMTFEATVQGKPRRYLFVLDVPSSWFGSVIRVAEYAAEKSRFDDHVDAVRRALASD